MTARVFVSISSGIPGGVLAIRDKIEAVSAGIPWLYDDALQILEMDGWWKWWDAEEQLMLLSARFPDLDLSWEIDSE